MQDEKIMSLEEVYLFHLFINETRKLVLAKIKNFRDINTMYVIIYKFQPLTLKYKMDDPFIIASVLHNLEILTSDP